MTFRAEFEVKPVGFSLLHHVYESQLILGNRLTDPNFEDRQGENAEDETTHVFEFYKGTSFFKSN